MTHVNFTKKSMKEKKKKIKIKNASQIKTTVSLQCNIFHHSSYRRRKATRIVNNYIIIDIAIINFLLFSFHIRYTL